MYYSHMDYREFQRQLGKAGLRAREFADLIRMSRNSVTNYSKKGTVPPHLAVIASLLGEMAEHQIEFRGVFAKLKIEPKKPRGSAAKGKFGGSKQPESGVRAQEKKETES